MSIKSEPTPAGKKVIEEIKNDLSRKYAGEHLFAGKDIVAIDYILTDLEIELDKIKGQWSGIEILNLINDHLRRYDTSDALVKALDVLAEHWLRGNSDDHYKIIKQIVDNIVYVERNNASWDREIVLQILRAIVSITKNEDINKEIERILRIWGQTK